MTNATSSQKSTNPAKWAWLVGLAFGITLLSWVAVLFFSDEPVQDISDLKAKYAATAAPVSSQGAAWEKFLEELPALTDFWDWPEMVDAPNFNPHALSPNDPLLEKYLNANAAVLAGLQAHLQTTPPSEMAATPAEPLRWNEESGLPRIQKAVQLTRLADHQARWEAGQGRVDEAVSLLLNVGARNRALLGRSEALLVELLALFATDGILENGLVSVLPAVSSRDTCQRVIAALASREPEGNDFKKVVFNEVLFGLDRLSQGKLLETVLGSPSFPPRTGFSFKPGATSNLFIKIFREMESMDWNVLPPPRTPTQERLSQTVNGAEWLRVFIPNYHGKNLIAANNLEPMVYVNRLRNARVRLCGTAFALRAYWLEHDQTLPPTLAALVPEYLPAVPLDPYAPSQPLRYNPALGRIWSVGEDGVDAGGDATDPSDPNYHPRLEPTVLLPWARVPSAE